MTKTRYNDKKLLLISDVNHILECYLIDGRDQGITFSEFFSTLNRRKVTKKWKDPKQTLKNRLRLMVREGLLQQEDKGKPYFLNTRWYNHPLKNLNKEIIDQTPLNYISVDVPFPGIQEFWGDDFFHGTLLYGINIEKLPEKYRIEILKKMRVANDTLASIYSLRYSLTSEWCIEAIESKIGNKIKNLDEDSKSALYAVLINVAKQSIRLTCGETPSRGMVEDTVNEEIYQLKRQFSTLFKSDILIDTVLEMNKKLVKLYPFTAEICLSSFGFYAPETRKKYSETLNQNLSEVFPIANEGLVLDRIFVGMENKYVTKEKKEQKYGKEKNKKKSKD